MKNGQLFGVIGLVVLLVGYLAFSTYTDYRRDNTQAEEAPAEELPKTTTRYWKHPDQVARAHVNESAPAPALVNISNSTNDTRAFVRPDFGASYYPTQTSFTPRQDDGREERRERDDDDEEQTPPPVTNTTTNATNTTTPPPANNTNNTKPAVNITIPIPPVSPPSNETEEEPENETEEPVEEIPEENDDKEESDDEEQHEEEEDEKSEEPKKEDSEEDEENDRRESLREKRKERKTGSLTTTL